MEGVRMHRNLKRVNLLRCVNWKECLGASLPSIARSGPIRPSHIRALFSTMRLKAVFTDRGLSMLEKAFLPTFEKFGRTLQVLVGPSEVHLVQSPLNTDGPHVMSRFAMEVLFDPTSYKCQSKHYNLIGFTLDVALLLRVIRAALANNADEVDVKLTQKNMPVPGSDSDTVAKPFLTFHARGHTLSMVQEIPISKPYSSSEIDKLVETREVSSLSPFYVDLQPCAPMLQSMVDRMKGVADTVLFATCKNGDVHVNVSAINMLLGTQVRELSVYPQEVTAEHPANRSLPAEKQLEEALRLQEASAVHVQLKHLSRALTVTQLTAPSQILCGVADSMSYVHIMYVFKNPSSEERFDDSVHLSVRLPTKDA